MSNNSNGGGIGLLGVLGIIFIVLKLRSEAVEFEAKNLAKADKIRSLVSA